jgi:hypothetical protein
MGYGLESTFFLVTFQKRPSLDDRRQATDVRRLCQLIWNKLVEGNPPTIPMSHLHQD